MPNNIQQPNNGDFADLEFDFDEEDVLVKEESGEVVSLGKENKKTAVSSQPRGQQQTEEARERLSRSLKKQLPPPLKLKNIKTAGREPAEEIKKIQENLLKQARLQKEKIKALNQEGEGLVYSEQDEEEIESLKKHPLIANYPDVGILAQRLISRIKIVSSLKINLIRRLKNIIDSYLRDIRATAATEDLLQRSLAGGGLNLSPRQAVQIMEIIKVEFNKIYSTIITPQPPPVGPACRQAKVGGGVKDDTISKKTAKEAQLGIFSDEISSKKQIDLTDWEEGLKIPSNLRTPEISAPETIKKIAAGKDKVKSFLKDMEKEELQPDEELAKRVEEPQKSQLLPESEVFEIFETAVKEDKNQKRPSAAPKAKSSLPVSWPAGKAGKADINPELEVERVELNKVEPLPAFFKEGKAEEEKKKPKVSWWSLFKKSKKDKQDKKKAEIRHASSLQPESSKKDIGATDKLKKPAEPSPASVVQVKPLKKQMPIQRSERVPPRVFRAKQKTDIRPKVEDVKVVQPRLIGPIEELSGMMLVDFRRLGPTVSGAVEKIREKIELAARESFAQKIAAINAWRKSQSNQLYLELGRQSLLRKIPIEDLISQYKSEGKLVLTKEEFELINQLNKSLRY